MKPPFGASLLEGSSPTTVPSFHKKGNSTAYASGLPLRKISAPTNLDVLCGRGVATNRHIGNENFRALVKCHKKRYVCSSKADKMKLSRFIVETIRAQNGRFLEKGAATDLWADIGDKKAIEKTSQALRDGAAPLRRKLAADAELEERSAKDKYTNIMEGYYGKRDTALHNMDEKLRDIVSNRKNDKTTKVGKNRTSKDQRVERKQKKPKIAKRLELKLPPLFPKLISTDSLPRPTTVPSSTTHLAAVDSSKLPNHIPQLTMGSLEQINLRSNTCFSPIPFSQENDVIGPVVNTSLPGPDNDFSFPHHIPAVEKNGWAPIRQIPPSHKSYNGSRICFTPPQEPRYDHSISPVRVPSSSHRVLISPPDYRAHRVHRHEIYPPPGPLSYNLYTPAIGNVGPCDASSHHDFPHAPSDYQPMQAKDNLLLSVKEEQELMQKIRSDRIRDNEELDIEFAQSNSVDASLEDVSFSPNDMAPLPYKSDNESSSSVTTSFTSEDDTLGWNVPYGYELKHNFLMNLIQSPLLE